MFFPALFRPQYRNLINNSDELGGFMWTLHICSISVAFCIKDPTARCLLLISSCLLSKTTWTYLQLPTESGSAASQGGRRSFSTGVTWFVGMVQGLPSENGLFVQWFNHFQIFSVYNVLYTFIHTVKKYFCFVFLDGHDAHFISEHVWANILGIIDEEPHQPNWHHSRSCQGILFSFNFQ